MLDLVHVCYGGVGGHRAVVTGLAETFRRVGIGTGVVAIAPAGDLLDSETDWPGVDRLWPVPLRRRGDVGSMAGALDAVRVAAPRVALVHTHRHVLPVAAGLLARSGRARLVTVEHTTHAGRYPLATANLAIAASLSHAVVYLSTASRDASPIRRLPLPSVSRSVVIPNGVDVARFAGEPNSMGAGVIGMATRLVPGKDVAGLIDAVAILAKDGRSVRLLVAGDGPDRGALEARAVERGISDRVEFLGRIPEARVPAFLDSLSVYVQATDGETASMSVLEAAAAGVPIVASRVTGIDGTFNGSAVLVSPRVPAALAEGIREVLDDPDASALRVASAKHLVALRFSARAMAAGYLRLLADVDPRGPWALAGTHLGRP